MTEQTSNPATEIKEMEIGQDTEPSEPRTQSDNSGQVEQAPPRPALNGKLERRFRRRNDINRLHGLIREHARLIAQMHAGRIPLDRAEVMSRAYGRHHQMLASLEQNQYLEQISSQLTALRGDRVLIEDDSNKEAQP